MTMTPYDQKLDAIRAERSGGVYETWRIVDYGGEPERRYFGGRENATHEAECIARSSRPDGAVSVWVKAPDGSIPWAAGVKAEELIEQGHEVRYGVVLS